MAVGNGAIIKVIWNGGWDEYAVDCDKIRPISQEEKKSLFPHTPDGYLLCKFNYRLTTLFGNDKAVKIVSRLRGGN